MIVSMTVSMTARSLLNTHREYDREYDRECDRGYNCEYNREYDRETNNEHGLIHRISSSHLPIASPHRTFSFSHQGVEVQDSGLCCWQAKKHMPFHSVR